MERYRCATYKRIEQHSDALISARESRATSSVVEHVAKSGATGIGIEKRAKAQRLNRHLQCCKLCR
jgi:hypothetical protein